MQKSNLGKIKNEILENKEIFFSFTIAISFIFGIFWLWHFFHLPSQKDLIEIVKNYYNLYGLPAIFIIAILEFIIGIGNYFPGMAVIFVALSVAGGNFILAVKTVTTIIAGVLIGHHINFFLGKYGIEKFIHKLGFTKDIENLQSKIKEKGIFYAFFLYFIPSLPVFISTALGISKINYFRFLLFIVPTAVFWNIFWATLSYFYGLKVFEALTSYYSIFIIMVLYFIYMYKSGKFEELKNK